MNVKSRYVFMLICFFLLSYILPLAARDLLVPDETRYAEIPREMIAGGDWVVPHFDGLRYFEKPPLGYWVHAVSILLFGENNFAARLPSAMAVGLSGLLIYLLVGRACRNETQENRFQALLAVLIYLSCFEVFGVGNTAVLDNLLSFFLTAAITTFYFASQAPPGSGKEKGFFLLAGLSSGLAFLTKGFLAFALPVLVLAPYLVWQRRYIDLFRMSWLPILSAVLVALPWGILIHLREPDFWRFFFWNEHIRRFFADTAQHEQSFWFFLMAAPGLFMPWTFVTPAATKGILEQIGGQHPRGRLIRLCICWLVLPFLFFSVSKGKLLTYILPCFPPFAILMALGVSKILDRGTSKAFQWGVAGTGFFFGLICLALIYMQVFNYGEFRLYGQWWKAILVIIGLVFMVLFCFWSFRSHHGRTKAFILGLVPLPLFFLGHFTIPDLVIEESAPTRLLEKHQYQIGPDSVIISCHEAVGATCWDLKRDDVYLLRSGGELNYGLHYKDTDGRLLDAKSATRLIDQNRGKTVLIARTREIRNLRNALPLPVYQDDSGPRGYVFWQY